MGQILFSVIALAAAFLLDWIIGDPVWLPHPVRLLGKIIEALEKAARKLFRTSYGLRLAGAIIVIITVALFVTPLLFLLPLIYLFHPAAGLLLETYILFAIFAGGDLRHHVLRIYNSLTKKDLPAARRNTAMIVSRDTANLDEDQLSRATLESLFENSTDGLVAPLFYTAIGGPMAVIFYKVVNTLDSMLGYKSERYIDLGLIPARLDDIMNYIPARLTALMLIAAAGGKAKGRGKLREALKILSRDHNKHESPNSAWPEAAAAGLLGLRLGGTDYHGGRLVERPLINAEGRTPKPSDIVDALQLYGWTAALVLIFSLVITFVMRFRGMPGL